MSNLDHGLVNANSLTGIGTIDEALDALQPGRQPGEMSLFDEILTDQLASAKTLLIDVANASEANKAEVEEGATTARPGTRSGRHRPPNLRRRGGCPHRPNRPRRSSSMTSHFSASSSCPKSLRRQTNSSRHTCPTCFPRCSFGTAAWVRRPRRQPAMGEVEGRGTDQWWGLRSSWASCSMPQKAARFGSLKEFRKSRPDLEGEVEREMRKRAGLNGKCSSRGPFPAWDGRHSTCIKRSLGATGNSSVKEAASVSCSHAGRSQALPLAAVAAEDPRRMAHSRMSASSRTPHWVFRAWTAAYTIGSHGHAKRAADTRGHDVAGPFAQRARTFSLVAPNRR